MNLRQRGYISELNIRGFLKDKKTKRDAKREAKRKQALKDIPKMVESEIKSGRLVTFKDKTLFSRSVIWHMSNKGVDEGEWATKVVKRIESVSKDLDAAGFWEAFKRRLRMDGITWRE